LEHFYGRNREADEHLKGAVENIKDVITGQATILALCPLEEVMRCGDNQRRTRDR